ncbi:hypothetical protein GGI23_002517, partial [Coemansia sp. RSA 2559]
RAWQHTPATYRITSSKRTARCSSSSSRHMRRLSTHWHPALHSRESTYQSVDGPLMKRIPTNNGTMKCSGVCTTARRSCPPAPSAQRPSMCTA